ncbi:MAG: class A beta-lactamase-related serine hydrolase [Sphingobacteriia bacterium]|nr:MAG: class A beta-lactamase-related serine hydrolase [Sphingobacteriia bacterium]
MDSLFARSSFSGIVQISTGGQVLLTKTNGWANREQQSPIDANTVFELASVSKQFTAMVIMQLQEAGKLQYDDPVSLYLDLPDYPGITIKHLLQHRSGLPDYQAIMDQHWDKSKVAGNADILDYLNRFHPPALFAPGEKYTYSNTGYVLLASIAEKASGKDFIELVQKNIFTPLNMRRTGIRTRAEKAQLKNVATGYTWSAQKNAFLPADSFPSSNYTIWLGARKGPGRISSTINDLSKWDLALYKGRVTRQLVTLERAFSPATNNNGSLSRYGFGWDILEDRFGQKMVAHNGDNPGFKTKIVRFLLSQTTLLVLCNNASEDFDYLAHRLEYLLAGN